MPRVNFAYDVKADGDLIVRGGAGVFYNRPMGNAEYDVHPATRPYAYSITMDAGSTQNFPGGRMDYNTIGQVDPFAFVGGIAVPQSVVGESVKYPRYFTTSLSVGKRLPWAQFLEVGYVGTFGRHLLNSRNDNIVPEGALTDGVPRPGPARGARRLRRHAVPQVPDARRGRLLGVQRDLELPLDAGDVEPADERPLPVLRDLHLLEGARDDQQRVHRDRPVLPAPAQLRHPVLRPDARRQPVVELHGPGPHQERATAS